MGRQRDAGPVDPASTAGALDGVDAALHIAHDAWILRTTSTTSSTDLQLCLSHLLDAMIR